MHKKIVTIVFVIILGVIAVDYFSDFFSPFDKYVFFLIVLGLGIIIYTTDFKFKSKVDFMILRAVAVAVFNIINLFIMKDFLLKMNFINIRIGTSGVLQSVIYKKVE